MVQSKAIRTATESSNPRSVLLKGTPRLLIVLAMILACDLPTQLDAQTPSTTRYTIANRIHRPLAQIETAQEWRDESPNRYLEVEADFDADGRLDPALFVGNDGEYIDGTFLLWVKTYSRIYYLAQVDLKELPLRGIDLVEPGEYETACGRGLRTCLRDEPETLKLPRPAISFFEHEGSRVFFYFDVDAKSWVRVDIDL